MDEYVSRDRLLLAISDTTIHGTTRLQKYGFLLYKQYGKELSAISSKHDNLTFYDDWKPYWFGAIQREPKQRHQGMRGRQPCLQGHGGSCQELVQVQPHHIRPHEVA